jgi:hypothetical protein
MPVQNLSVFEELKKVDALVDARNEPEMVVARLPFTVRVVQSDEDLEKAVQLRYSAYTRHMPEYGETLRDPEASDRQPGVVLLLASSKLDGSPLGTMRIQTNAFAPLTLEQSIDLPPHLKNASLAAATRLGVVGASMGTLAKMVLFKAYFLYCEAAGIDWMVVAARSPLDRQYERLMFTDVDPSLGYVQLHHASTIPHRIMCFEPATAQSRWRAANHPMYNFMIQTSHPDIDVGIPLVSRASAPASIARNPRPTRDPSGSLQAPH